jgi:hypothetical protein
MVRPSDDEKKKGRDLDVVALRSCGLAKTITDLPLTSYRIRKKNGYGRSLSS